MDRYGVDNLADACAWCEAMREKFSAAQAMGEELLAGLAGIEAQAEAYFREMDFAFLFAAQREVFHIGYNVTAGKLDGNFYDLLASEARIASLVALAKREAPRSHWMHLGRPLTQVDGAARAAILERDHVRVPDADAAYALIRGDLAA